MTDVSQAGAVDGRVLRTRNDVLRTALRVLIEEGWPAVTHQYVAKAAGYSRATLYAHWPTRSDLVRDAFSRLGEMPHHTPTGDLRADLVAELLTYRVGMQEHGLDRALAVLSDLTHSVPELVAVRDQLVVDGEQVLRGLLEPLVAGPALDAAAMMLAGVMLQSALLHGTPPTDQLIEAAVEVVLHGVAPPTDEPPVHRDAGLMDGS